jgi:hypothetical protein
MKITKTSKLTGAVHTREIAVTGDQIAELNDSKRTRLIQHICPHLDAEDREFLMTGITSEEWLAMGWHEGDES